MWALVMKYAPGIVVGLLQKWLGIGPKSEATQEREAGEKLGVAETENRNAQNTVDELRAAAGARSAAGAELDAQPDGVRGAGPDFAKRGSDGIS